MNATIGKGVYSYGEAARLTGLNKSRIKEWFRGRTSAEGRKAFLSGDYLPVDGDNAISFHDLIDVCLAGQLREHGVSLQTIRRLYQKIAHDLNAKHPFCRKELLADGKEIMLSGSDAEGREELNEVLTRKKVYPEIILPFLKRIDYDKGRLARRWRIAPRIVVDPAVCFGKPVVEECSIPTLLLAEAYYANLEDAEAVGNWYNVRADDVLAAVDFEGKLAA